MQHRPEYNPTDKLALTLEAQQWQVVIAILSQGPYRDVAPILKTLDAQIMAGAPQANILPFEKGESA